MSKILYTVVAIGSGEFILIEANIGSNQAKYVKSAQKVLKKILKGEVKRPNGLATLLHLTYAYNYIHGCEPEENNPILETLIFLCVTESTQYGTSTQPRELAYRFLLNIRNIFISQFQNDLHRICNMENHNVTDSINIENNFDDEMRSHFKRFAALTKDEMIQYGEDYENDDSHLFVVEEESNSNNNNNNNNSKEEKKDENGILDVRRPPPPSGDVVYRPESGSKMTQIINQIDQVKVTVLDGIEHALERNEEISLLNNKASNLNESSFQFNRNSRNLRRHFCRELYQQKLIVVFVAIFILYLLSAMFCGWSWGRCSS